MKTHTFTPRELELADVVKLRKFNLLTLYGHIFVLEPNSNTGKYIGCALNANETNKHLIKWD